MLVQKIQQYPSKIFSAITLCFLMLFATTSSEANSSIDNMNYSGKDLFEGIYFASGPVAQKVEMLQNFSLNNFVKDPEQQNDILNFKNQILERVSEEHAPFLEKLEADIASRNKYKIKSTVMRGYGILKNLVETMSEGEINQLHQEQFRALMEDQVDMNKASAEEISAAAQEVIAQAEGACILIAIVLPFPPVLYIYSYVIIGAVEAHPEGLFQDQLIGELSRL